MIRGGGVPTAPQLALHPGYIAGKSYLAFEGTVSTGTAVPAIDIIYLYAWRVFAPITITSAFIRVLTGGAGSSAKAGIWANSPVSGRPLGVPLLADNTGVATTSNNANANLTMSGSLAVGVYWIGTKFTGTLPVCTNVASTSLGVTALVPIGSSSTIGNNAFGFADAYANAMPTIIEGATFSFIGANGVPIMAVNT